MKQLNLGSKFDFVDLSNKAFSETLSDCLHGTENLVINAAAGSGKSLMIKIIAHHIKNSIVVSPTGMTALNLSNDGVPATTIHSFFSFPPYSVIDISTCWQSKAKRQSLEKAKVIIIDEISMVSSQLFDCIVGVCNRVRKNKPVKFILFGDLMQLPPVVDNSIEITNFYEKHYRGKQMFFNSHSFRKLGFQKKFLNKIYRQKDDDLKQHIFNVGYNNVTDKTLDYFSNYVKTQKDFSDENDNYIHLAFTNAIVNKINHEYVKKFEGDEYTYKATNDNWPGSSLPNDMIVKIKLGMQVMCTMNDTLVKDKEIEPPAEFSSFRNGSVGKVVGLNERYVDIELSNGSLARVGFITVLKHEPFVDDFGNIQYKIVGSFTQIACKPMKACTIHKAQGKEFERVYIQMTPFTAPGLLYVGLSRVKSPSGLAISRPLTLDDVEYNYESFEYLNFDDTENYDDEENLEDIL